MSGHLPVMLAEVLEALEPHDGAHYIDGTFGGGGYARAILEACDCRVLGIDRDPEAIARGEALVALYPGRLTLVHGEFSQMDKFLADAGEDGTNGVVLDLGVSSFQFDEPARGFSFRADGPLDMRMSASGLSAADVVNTEDEKTLADIIVRYGEEHQARRIARAIVADRPFHRAPGAGRTGLARARPRRGTPADPSRHAHLPGVAHPCERRTGRACRAPSKRRRARFSRRAASPSFRSIRWKTASSNDFSSEHSAAAPRASRHRRRRARRPLYRLLAARPARRAKQRSRKIRVPVPPNCARGNAWRHRRVP